MIINRLQQKFNSFDERFIMHRYYSTRLATTVGSLMIAGWFLYAQRVQGELRWDLVSIAIAMGVTKVSAMVYLRFTN